ncbi:MAG TPA: hypothetical protein VFF60_04990 [Candidatus Binatus sp.]|nr:hypothetical protein [Candidatus Binatus sp.]
MIARTASTTAFLLMALVTMAAADSSSQSMAQMKFMLGTWTCSVKAVDGSTAQITSLTTLSSDGTHLLTKTTAGGEGTSEIWLDPNQKQWVQTASSSKGSSTQNSPGFNRAMIVWNGTVTAAGMPAMPYRTTMTKLSDTKTTQVDELGTPGGSSWLTADSATCAKAH